MSYAFVNRDAKRVLRVFVCLGLLLVAFSVQAQDVTQTEISPETPVTTTIPPVDPLITEIPPTENVTLPTQEITPAPVETTPLPTEESTPAPTEALPTQEVTPVATEEIILTEEATSLPTQEVTPVETITPVVADSLPLTFSTGFDAAYPSELSANTGWVEVNVADGKALQSNGEAVAVIYTPGIFTNAAVEASFLLNAGEGQVALRDYTAELSATGIVTLYRRQTAVSSAVLTLTDGQWVKLRLQTTGTQVQVSVDNARVIDYGESEIIAAGSAGFSATAGAILRLDDFAIYGIATPAAPIATEATPAATEVTPAPTEVTATATEIPTEEALPVVMMSGEPLNVPTSVVLNGNGTSVDIAWDDTNLSETGYEIQRYVSDAYSATSIIGTTGVDTGTFTEANVGCGLTLWYRVRAVRSSDSTVSDWSDWVSVTTAPCTADCNSNAAVQRVSVGTNSTYQTNGVLMPSGRAVVSNAGNTYVLFGSANPLQDPVNELLGENNVPNVPDVYLYVMQNCTTYKFSNANGGAESAQAAYPGGLDYLGDPIIGLDSIDPNLTSNDGSSTSSVFISDGLSVSLVSLQTGGSAQIPGNTRFVDIAYPYILMSTDGDLSGLFGVTDTNNANDLVLYNHQAQTLSLVTFDYGGVIANAGSSVGRVFIADDNTPYVLFSSAASNVVSGDSNGVTDVFLRNMTTGVTTRISLSDTEGQLTSASGLGGFSLVGMTLKVGFETASRETGVAGGPTRILVRTVSLATPGAGTTILASRAIGAAGTIAATSSYGGRLSRDGRWIVFSSADSTLVTGDTNGVADVFVRDLTSNVTQRVSLSNSGAQLTSASAVVDISQDGRTILFSSASSNVVSNDTANVCETDMVDSNPSLAGIQYDYNDNCTDIFATSNPLAYSATPVGVTASTTYNDKVRLTWSPVSFVQGFVIEASTDNGANWNTVATLSNGVAISYDYAFVCGASVKLRIKSTVTTPYPLVSSPSSVVTGQTTICVSPVLSTPADKAFLNTTTVSLTWTKPHVDATGYEIDLAKTATFTAASRVSGYPQTSSTESFDATGLTDGTYYWRVRAVLPGVGAYSLTRSFTVDTVAPASAPLITAPENASTVRTMSPKFTWTAVPTATRYSLVVTDGTNVMVNQPNLTLLTYTFSGLPVQSVYTATVIAYDAAGNASAPSQITFTLNPALTPTTGTFIKTASADGDWFFTRAVFTWAGAGANTSYAVQLFTEPNFLGTGQVNGCYATGVTTCTIDNLIPVTYWWRVVRQDEDASIIVPVSNILYLSPALPSIGLEQPANNAYLTPSQHPSGEVTLQWDKGDTPRQEQLPLKYEVEVNTSSTFAVEPVFTQSDLSAHTVTTSALADGTYYWRVRATNALGITGEWTTGFKFIIDSIAPAAPAIVTPAQLTLFQTPQPTITWTGPLDAYRYEVEVNDSCDDGSPEYNSGATITTKTFVVPQLLNQGTHEVCVRAYDAAMNPGAFSAARKFKIFLGTSPADNVFIPAATKPTFTWTAAAGTGVTLEYSTSDLFPSGSTTQIAVTGVSKTLTAPLAAGVYYWRVKRSGEVLPIAFTDSTAFRTLYIGSLLSGPTLTSPASGALLSAATTTLDLDWQDVDSSSMSNLNITKYQVAISTNAAFAPTLTTTTTVSAGTQPYQWTLPANQNRVVYYWHVRAMYGSTPVSNWSATRSVTIDNVLPAVPTITAPLSNALVNTVRPTFTWGSVAGATGYRVSITDLTTSTDLVSDAAVTTLAFTPSVNLPQDNLMFTVLATDGLNESTSAVVMFKVRLGTAPVQNVAVTTPRPTFTWMAVPGTGVKYTLEVARDAAFSNLVFSQANIAVASYVPTVAQGLPAAGNYYWRVNHTGTNSGFPADNGARFFTYIYSTQAKPTNLAARINGTAGAVESLFSADEDAPIGLTWNAPVGSVTPTGYQVEVATNAAFTTGLVSIDAGTNTYATISEGTLTDGLKYWRVKALYSADGTGSVASDSTTFTLDTVAPLAPSSLSTAGSLSIARPTFKWVATPSAVRYHLSLYREYTPTASRTVIPGYEDILVTGTSYTIPQTMSPLAQIRRAFYGYRWVVRAEDAAGNLSLEGKNLFSLWLGNLTTTNNFLTDSTPTFTWERNIGAGAASIELQIASDSDMSPIVYTSGALAASTTGFTVPDVSALPEGRYWWRVLRSGDDPDDVEPLVVLRVNSLSAITPVITSPGAVTLSKAQLQADALTWNAITAPGGTSSTCCYNLKLYLTPPASDSASPYLNYSISQTSAGSSFAHIPAGTYYWRVQARVGYGIDSYVSPFSAYRMFIYDPTPPSDPVLSAPLSQAVITTTRRPTFTWAASTGGAVKYVFEVGTDSSFNSNVLYTATLTSPLSVTLPASVALPNGTYYWRVRAIDAPGNISTGSVRQFRIAVS